MWSPNLQSVLWTDIEKSTLWMYRPHDGIARQWSLPDRLGCFAMCRSGRLLLGLAKSLAFAEVDFDGDSPLRIAPVMPIEPGRHPDADQRRPHRSRRQLRVRDV